VPIEIGLLVDVADVTDINVALPPIREDPGYTDVSVSDLRWIVKAHPVCFSVLMRAGRRFAYIPGMEGLWSGHTAVLA
jgi:hypothetical protein